MAALPLADLPETGNQRASAPAQRAGALRVGRSLPLARGEDAGAGRKRLEPEDSVRLTGYQYVGWQFDGDDLIYVVRTANRGARNFHDSNRILFGRERDFRSLL